MGNPAFMDGERGGKDHNKICCNSFATSFYREMLDTVPEISGKGGQTAPPRTGPWGRHIAWEFSTIILKPCLTIGSFFIITVTKHWQYYGNLNSNNKYTVQNNEAHQCLSGNLNRNWVTGLLGAKMKALPSFIAMLSISSPPLLQRACRVWRRQQALQEELKHRNILFHPLAFHGKKKTLQKLLSPVITAKTRLTQCIAFKMLKVSMLLHFKH